MHMHSFSCHMHACSLFFWPYFFCQLTVFFSHNKSVNSNFSLDFSYQRIGQGIDDMILSSKIPAADQSYEPKEAIHFSCEISLIQRSPNI
jgi:hypothetical protein